MKFTLSWLKEHLNTTASLETISTTLTSLGLEVEEVIDHAGAIREFVVAEIVEAAPHPDAQKLRVCKVNDGTGVRQIVCGASNARAGIKVVLAKEGVKIPAGGLVIKKTAIRGVESNGMLCSAAELALSEDSKGIIELTSDALPGSSAASALGLDDPVIDIAITPNRADCLGVRGIARDLAAAGLGTLIDDALHIKHAVYGASPIKVALETTDCPLFIGCFIRNVKNGPSPDWMQNRLKAIGLRPISMLVDITNYMTYTYNRPLHVFDADKLQGDITVRHARQGETLLALDGREYTLSPDMAAVCDDSGVLGLGGIIGGAATGCGLETKNIFLEAALFDPVAIARTGRKLMIDSDARYRFERGVDPAFAREGADIAIRLILELCGGEASECVIAGNAPEAGKTIAFDYKKVAQLGGVTLTQGRIQDILSALGFIMQESSITVPSWRADITGQADVVEEVLRVNGYDAIPSLPLPVSAPLQAGNGRVANIRKTLAASGMTEICSWAFVSEKEAVAFGTGASVIKLLNPISRDLDTMRPGLMPNLLSAVSRNSARGFSSLSLFEIGNVFSDTTPEGQKMMAAGIYSDTLAARSPFGPARNVDAFDAKAALFTVLETTGLNPARLHIDRAVPDYYHPLRSGRISLGGKVTLGYFGELHPLILEQSDITVKTVGFEAFLDAIPLSRAKSKARPPLVISNFQAVERDFAFVGDAKIAAADIVKTVEACDKQLIQNVTLFDIYSGKGVEEGKKSIAFSVRLQAMDRTLLEQEITTLSQKIIASAAGLGLSLRN